MFLSLGIAFDQAIDTAKGLRVWIHGKACYTGILMAVIFSVRLVGVDNSVAVRTKDLLIRAGLPVSSPDDMAPEQFLSLMAVDKKVVDKQLRLVLLTALGEAITTSDFSHEALGETLLAI